jgi:hypothetical protein
MQLILPTDSFLEGARYSIHSCAGLIRRSLDHSRRITNVILALLQKISRGFPTKIKLAQAPHDGPSSRLSLISRHLQQQPLHPLNTPFSIQKASIPHSQIRRLTAALTSTEPVKMSSQPPHPALLIPGPVEFDDAVLQSMSHYRYNLPVPEHQSECCFTFENKN